MNISTGRLYFRRWTKCGSLFVGKRSAFAIVCYFKNISVYWFPSRLFEGHSNKYFSTGTKSQNISEINSTRKLIFFYEIFQSDTVAIDLKMEPDLLKYIIYTEVGDGPSIISDGESLLNGNGLPKCLS